MKDLDIQEGLCHVTASAPLQVMFGYTSFLRSAFIVLFLVFIGFLRRTSPVIVLTKFEDSKKSTLPCSHNLGRQIYPCFISLLTPFSFSFSRI